MAKKAAKKSAKKAAKRPAYRLKDPTDEQMTPPQRALREAISSRARAASARS